MSDGAHPGTMVTTLHTGGPGGLTTGITTTVTMHTGTTTTTATSATVTITGTRATAITTIIVTGFTQPRYAPTGTKEDTTTPTHGLTCAVRARQNTSADMATRVADPVQQP